MKEQIIHKNYGRRDGDLVYPHVPGIEFPADFHFPFLGVEVSDTGRGTARDMSKLRGLTHEEESKRSQILSKLKNPEPLKIVFVEASDNLETYLAYKAAEQFHQVRYSEDRSLKSRLKSMWFGMTETYQMQRLIERERQVFKASKRPNGSFLDDNERDAILNRFLTKSPPNDLPRNEIFPMDAHSHANIIREVQKMLRAYLTRNWELSGSVADYSVEVARSMGKGIYQKLEEKDYPNGFYKCGKETPIIDNLDMIAYELCSKVNYRQMTLDDAYELIDSLDVVIGKSQCLNAEAPETMPGNIAKKAWGILNMDSTISPLLVGGVFTLGLWFATTGLSTLSRMSGAVLGAAVVTGVLAGFLRRKEIDKEIVRASRSAALAGLDGSKLSPLLQGKEGVFEGEEVSELIEGLSLVENNLSDNELVKADGLPTPLVEDALRKVQEVKILLTEGIKTKRDFIKWDSPSTIEQSRWSLLEKVAVIEAAIFNKAAELEPAKQYKFIGQCEKISKDYVQNYEARLNSVLADQVKDFVDLRFGAMRSAFKRGGLLGVAISSLVCSVANESQVFPQNLNNGGHSPQIARTGIRPLPIDVEAAKPKQQLPSNQQRPVQVEPLKLGKSPAKENQNDNVQVEIPKTETRESPDVQARENTQPKIAKSVLVRKQAAKVQLKSHNSSLNNNKGHKLGSSNKAIKNINRRSKGKKSKDARPAISPSPASQNSQQIEPTGWPTAINMPPVILPPLDEKGLNLPQGPNNDGGAIRKTDVKEGSNSQDNTTGKKPNPTIMLKQPGDKQEEIKPMVPLRNPDQKNVVPKKAGKELASKSKESSKGKQPAKVSPPKLNTPQVAAPIAPQEQAAPKDPKVDPVSDPSAKPANDDKAKG